MNRVKYKQFEKIPPLITLQIRRFCILNVRIFYGDRDAESIIIETLIYIFPKISFQAGQMPGLFISPNRVDESFHLMYDKHK